MTHDEFDAIFAKEFDRSHEVLVQKANEYATTDRLHNFRVAAALQGMSARQALGGMLAKHIVSIYDLLAKDELAPQATWDEKVGDSINYHILLQAIVWDEAKAIAEAMPQTTEGTN